MTGGGRLGAGGKIPECWDEGATCLWLAPACSLPAAGGIERVMSVRQIATCIIWGPKATIYSISDL
jgi:hypothetical protein